MTSTIYDTHLTLKPLCPTRWLCRVRSITAVINQYDVVLTSLNEMGMTIHGAIATRAEGLHDYFQKGTTLLAIRIAIKFFSMLEELNRSFQCKSGTLSGMLQAVQTTKQQTPHWISLELMKCFKILLRV